MKATFHCVSWTRHYVFPDTFTVKLCGYVKSTGKPLLWTVCRTVLTVKTKTAAYQTARKLAAKLGLPLFRDVIRSHPVTNEQRKELIRRNILDKRYARKGA